MSNSKITFSPVDAGNNGKTPSLEMRLGKNDASGVYRYMLGRQGDYHVGLIPEFNVSGYGSTAEEAMNDLRYNFKIFLDDLFELSEVQRIEELKRLGWTRGSEIFKKRYINRSVDLDSLLKEYDAPDSVTIGYLKAA